MTRAGFQLTKLALIGKDVPNADVHFKSGLNVISGPSDTGKTFIAQCIDFMLGGSKAPKSIPEAESYETLRLGLRGKDDDTEFVLERSLRGGDFRLHVSGKEVRVLSAKHQAENENTVSHFLLSLSHLTGKKVRTNKHGKTRPISFRDVARLILIDEETVISEGSPIYSGQYVTSTAEGSLFRLILSGIDDSSVVSQADPKISRIRQEGKTEMIDALVEQTREKLAELKLEGNVDTLKENFVKLDSLFESASIELAAEQGSIAKTEERRRSAWSRLRQVESRSNVLSELQRRFELLEKQYSSDLRRLEAISEAGVRLGEMKEERCPVCGAVAEHQDHDHQRPHASPDEVVNACRAEADKIRGLLADLHSTLVDNQAEVVRLNNEGSERRAELEVVAGELQTQLQPRVQAALQKFRDSQATRDLYRRALDFYGRIDDLDRFRREIEKPKRAVPADPTSVAVGTGEAEQFSKEVEALLRSWHFPNLDRVTFSEEDQDLIISGRSRASHGKGVRAITHAAFNIALLKFCEHKSMPHPGLVIVDSPLVVYREPDPDESGFSVDVKDAFYRSLSSEFESSQIIILENEDPPSDLNSKANVVRFSGTKHGRAGFISK